MAIVRPAVLSDGSYYWGHIRRHMRESGREGDLIFAPTDSEWLVTLENFEREKREGWSKTVHEIGWERAWVIADSDGVYGNLRLLHMPPIPASLHRATLMMGIERSHRGRGYGAQLMTQALAWARSQNSLEWLQLYVFDHNEPAKALYRKFGFIENGTTPDRFRVGGQRIADTSMLLKLR